MRLRTGKAGVIFDRIIGFPAGVGALLIVFMMLVVCAEIVCRYFLRSPIAWEASVSESILLYVPFLGAAWVLKREGHVRVDILVSRLNPRTQTVLNFISSIIGIVVCVVLIVYGSQVTWQDYIMGYKVHGAVELPIAPISAIIPIGSFLLLIEFLRRIYRDLRQMHLVRKVQS